MEKNCSKNEKGNAHWRKNLNTAAAEEVGKLDRKTLGNCFYNFFILQISLYSIWCAIGHQIGI